MNLGRKGQGLAEYALILALVSVSVIVVVTQLGGAVGNTFSNVMCVMDNTNNCGLDTTDSGNNPGSGNTSGGSSSGDTSGGSSSGDTSGGSSSGDTSGGSSSGDTSGGSSSGDTSGGSSSGDTGDTGGGGGALPGGGSGTSGDGSGTSGDGSGSSDSSTGYQYFRLVAQSEVNGNPWTSIAELNLVDESRNTISKSGWSLQYVDSEETSGENGSATNAFDGNNNTIWHTQWQGGSPGHNHEIQINLGQAYQLAQLRYLPRQSGENGRVANYTVYVSVDASNWVQVGSGTFPNSNSEQVVDLTGASSSSTPDVCATATAPTGAVFQLETFSGSTVTDLSGNGNNATSSSGHYTMSNSSSINTSTFNAKTLGVRFSTGSETSGRQIIFEQGGSTRGINVYIDAGQVYVGIWNRSTWDTRYISAGISTNNDYSVVLVYNNPNIQVYVNGNLAGSFSDVGELTSHSGGIGVMGMNSNTYYHDGSGSSSADFSGSLSALLQWNSALSGGDLNALQTYLDCS